MHQFPRIPVPIPAGLRQNVLKLTRHEAGHLIAAKIVGFKTGAITMEITDLRGGHNGTAEIIMPRPLRTTEETMQYLSDRVAVLWAGALAEALLDKTSAPNAASECLNNGGGVHDHAKARELINLLRNLRFPQPKTETEHNEELKALEKEVWGRAIIIVQNEESLIVEIAERLARMIKMTATKYALSSDDIASMPCIVTRFGDQQQSPPHSSQA